MSLLTSLFGEVDGDLARTWEIPTGGNAYLTATGGDDSVGRGGLRWASEDSQVTFFFHASRAAELELALHLTIPDGRSEIQLTSGETSLTQTLEASDSGRVPFGVLMVEKDGYVRVDLRGKNRTGPVFAEIDHLEVATAQPNLELHFVREADGNRFYWGRRGPSVHLQYQMPAETDIEWAYSEVTVPEGEDPIGSYFMANGFGEGYFGIQVNSPKERRVLFSVWSPYQTDDPDEIPEDQRIQVLDRGEEVHTGKFGNEGSGGQSYLVYPWKAEKTYRFLTRVRPDGEGRTRYAGWFGTPGGGWKLIAEFKRPKTDTHLTRFHGFLENFNPSYGHHSRGAWYGNQWVRDTAGDWHEITAMRFTGDDIARRGYRLDFSGGAQGSRFFLRNGGFTDEHVPLNSRFTREGSPDGPPQIDFADFEKP